MWATGVNCRGFFDPKKISIVSGISFTRLGFFCTFSLILRPHSLYIIFKHALLLDFFLKIVLGPRLEISVSTDISVVIFYGYIGEYLHAY